MPERVNSRAAAAAARRKQLLEVAEELFLEHGYAIKIVHAPAPHPGIDPPEQYAAFVQRFGKKTKPTD